MSKITELEAKNIIFAKKCAKRKKLVRKRSFHKGVFYTKQPNILSFDYS